MRNHLLTCALCATAALGACDDARPTGPEVGSEALLAASGAAQSEASVLTFQMMEEVGTSRLTRTTNGISFQVSTTNLEPGTATTVWVLIFNQPENCATSPCGEPDLFNPEVMADVVSGAGHVVGSSGQADFAGHRREGDASGSIFAPLGLTAPGLIDSETAEIHFVLRSHGPVIPTLLPDMIQTFNGGCENPGAPFPDPLPSELGTPGPNSCMDIQFAVHQP